MSDAREEDQEPEEPAVDLTDPKVMKRSLDRVKRELEERASFWRKVLNDRIGRRELWRLIVQEGHAFNPEFACGPNGFPQVEATWFKAGERNFAQRLYHELAAMDREGVLKMHDEHDPRFAKPKRTLRTA